MPSIIKVTPLEEYFSITWRLSKRCNYDCMYCSTEWHDNTSNHYTLEELQSYWIDIFFKTSYRNLKYKIALTGGEVTSSKYLLPFLEWLRTEYKDVAQVLLTTNGSATFNYYQRLLQYVDNISFSVHSEFMNEAEFFDTVIKLKQALPKDKFIHVNIMDEFWNSDRIELYKNLLTEQNISYNVNKIHYGHQTRAYPLLQGKLNLGT